MIYYIMCTLIALLIGTLVGLHAGFRTYGHRLESTRRQSNKHLMIVRLNDIWMMTKDRTKGDYYASCESLERCHEKYEYIKVLRQENQSLCAARNLALSAANGKDVCFLDSDA